MATATAKKQKGSTAIPVRFGEEKKSLYRIIEARARAQSRSVSGQIKYYARLGLVAKDNPDLPMAFIEGILEALEESRTGLSIPYQWGVLR